MTSMSGAPLKSLEDREASERDARRDNLLERLGSRVRALRLAGKWSQQALAQRARLSPRFIAQIEAGRGNISVARLAEVARGLGASFTELLDAAHPAPPPAGDRPSRESPRDLSPGSALRAEIGALVEQLPVEVLRDLRDRLRGGDGWNEGGLPPLIALVGLRGAGKSTVGALLAEEMGCPFLELDEEIRKATGMVLSEIFELHGEGYYREAEREALEGLLAREVPLVVAMSGGAVADPQTFRLLRNRTTLVWVKASPEEHMARVASQGDRRPMAGRHDAMAELRALLAGRTPYYAQARFIADTSAHSSKGCAERLAIALRRMD